MAKQRKKRTKKYRPDQNPQTKTVHRYSAEDEEKKSKHKKLKIKGIAAAIVAAVALLIGFLIF